MLGCILRNRTILSLLNSLGKGPVPLNVFEATLTYHMKIAKAVIKMVPFAGNFIRISPLYKIQFPYIELDFFFFLLRGKANFIKTRKNFILPLICHNNDKEDKNTNISYDLGK